MPTQRTTRGDFDDFARACIQAIAVENDGRRSSGSFCKCNRVLATVARLTEARLAHLDAWLIDETMEPGDAILEFYDRFVALVRRGDYVEGQGNFGDDAEYAPAHPKFLECRLTERGLREVLPR